MGVEWSKEEIGMRDATASQQIDAIIQKTAGWRGERLAQLRTLIRDADPGVVEEVKWKKPSRPEASRSGPTTESSASARPSRTP
jgi:hypothetical protein